MKYDAPALALRLAQAKFAFLAAVPACAYAAEQTVRHAELESVTSLVWLFLWLFSTAGWAIVHLDTLVEWFAQTDETPSWPERIALWRARLKIIQNYIASVGAGVAFYLLAKSVPAWVGLTFDVPEMVTFVGVVPAAMGGTATWDKIRDKFFSGEK